MKLVAVLGSPAPYTTPILNALAGRLDLHVVYLASEDRVSRFDDSWGVPPEYEHSIHWARRLAIPSADLNVELSVGVTRTLGRLDPDVLLLVSWNPAVLEPLLWARLTQRASVMWSESTAYSGLVRGGVSARARSSLARLFDAYVTNGTQAAGYLEQLGVRPERIVTSSLPAGRGPHDAARANPTPEVGMRFLFVGRLLAQKRPVELIEAFSSVHDRIPDATLTIVGAGELEAEVRRAAERAENVEYVGRKEGDDLAAVYAASDVLVLPALREVWAIVVNEALSHGLFVIATDQVGSAFDLLDDDNGKVLPATELQQLGPALVEAATTLDRSDAARRRRAQAVETCTPERFAADIERAAEIALAARSSRRRRA